MFYDTEITDKIMVNPGKIFLLKTTVNSDKYQELPLAFKSTALYTEMNKPTTLVKILFYHKHVKSML